jgi:hypothetical protein
MSEILTLITPEIAPHCKEIGETHAEYAQRHGYIYTCKTEKHWPEHAASFSKVWFIHEALQKPENQSVMWVDADVAFTNMRVDIGKLLEPDYWMAGYSQKNNECVGGRPYVCAGLLVIRCNDHARKFWADVLEQEPRWHTDNIVNKIHPWEQWYVDEQLSIRNFEGVHCCDTDEIGGFSREFWNDGHPWVPGCPTVHISASGNWPGRRQAFLKHYQRAIVR